MARKSVVLDRVMGPMLVLGRPLEGAEGHDMLARVVAKVNYEDGLLFDWAAYAGAGTQADVAASGDKVGADLAGFLFPQLDIDRYRA